MDEPNHSRIIALFLRQVTKGLILLEFVRWECKKRMSFENVIMRYCKPHFTFLFDNTVCGVFFKQTILLLAFEWKWGWCWLCFDRNLTASLSCKFSLISRDYFYRVKVCAQKRTTRAARLSFSFNQSHWLVNDIVFSSSLVLIYLFGNRQL